jgi:hypothetical protein
MNVINDNDDDEKWWIDRLVYCRGKKGCVLLCTYVRTYSSSFLSSSVEKFLKVETYSMRREIQLF